MANKRSSVIKKKSRIQPGRPGEKRAFSAILERTLFGAKEQQSYLEDLATLVEDGVPANKAVEVLFRIGKGSVKTLSEQVVDVIAQGRPIADGLIGWVPEHIVELIRAGEEGGTLAQNMRVAGETLGRKNEVFGALFNALTYPIVVLITGVSVMIYLKQSVFLQFATIKPVNEWPADGQRLLAMATFFQNWWWLLVMLIIAVIMCIARILVSYTGGLRPMLDKIPLVNVYRSSTAARFMETLGLLIINGIVFKQALSILHKQASRYLGWHISQMERRLSRGSSNIADVLDTGLVTRADIVRLRAIAEAKGFEHALVRLGRYAAKKNVMLLIRVAKVMGGMLLATGALLAMLMVFGIYNVGSSLS